MIDSLHLSTEVQLLLLVVISIIIGLVFGVLITWHRMQQELTGQKGLADQELSDAIDKIERLDEERSLLQRNLGKAEIDKARFEETVMQLRRAELKLENVIVELRQEIQQLQEQGAHDGQALAESRTRLKEQQRHNEEKLQEFEAAQGRLKVEFENLANRILEEKGRRFDEQSRKNIDAVLNPVREQLSDFRKRIDDIHSSDTRERASLKTELQQLHTLNQQMNDEARNLTRALKGDKKAQGNWGELILEKVLEESGLRKGREYEVQGSFRDSEGKLLRPDVIIHLPEGKDIIVDSKVSLSAYDAYIRADDDQEQQQSIAQLVRDVKSHIDQLSGKQYEDLKGINSLDFVLMFMPVEPAFIAAFQQAPELFSNAFENKIVVVTPTTLLASLRTIENIWRFEHQNEHARVIADKAGTVYDKLRGFLEDFEKVGAQLETVHKTYAAARNKLVEGRGNLVRQTESFVELGVKVKKKLPQSVLDDVLLDDSD
jgi:DNA recombination protein RmuC